jgi:hypothetical protein
MVYQTKWIYKLQYKISSIVVQEGSNALQLK